MVIAVSYHETVTKLQEFSGLAQGPFDRSEWYALLWRDEAKPIIAHSIAGEGQAALVLKRTETGFESLSNWFTFAWRPLGNSMPALVELAADLRKHGFRVILSPVPEEDGSASLLEAAFREAGWLVFRTQCDENHVLPVEGRSFAQYWAQRPGRMRTTLKRKAKTVEVEILKRFDDDAWNSYREIYETSWKPEEEHDDTLEAFARAEGQAGRIRLGLARCDGRPIAAQFWTVENGTAYIHKLAHREDAKQLSPGTTLSAALFEQVIDKDRVTLIDFGTGSDAYKRDWMELARPRFRLVCLDPRNPRAWPAIAKQLLRTIARRLASAGADR